MHRKFLRSQSSQSEKSERSEEESSAFEAKNLKTNAEYTPSHLKNIKISIPKLDLTQAKKIQEYNAKRSTPVPNGGNVDQKMLDKLAK